MANVTNERLRSLLYDKYFTPTEMDNDYSIFHHGYSVSELRKMLNMRNLPGFIETKALEELCHDVISIAREGLAERELGGEVFLSV